MKLKIKLDVGVESVIFFQIDSAFLKSKKKVLKILSQGPQQTI
jgi:hypothetical protein